MNKHKYFNGKKYFLKNGYWSSTSRPHTKLSHNVWNYYNPNDIIKDGEMIHHINKNPDDNRIENLEKMTIGEHTTLHHTGVPRSEKTKQKIKESLSDMSGKRNHNWRGGIKFKQLYLYSKTVEKGYYYEICQYINSLGEIKSSGFRFRDGEK